MKVKKESENVGSKFKIQKTKIMASGPITPWQTRGETVTDFILGGSKISADHDHSHETKRCVLLGRKIMTNLDSIIKTQRQKKKKTQRHYFADKGPSSQSFGFSSSHVWMWELECKESWVPKKWCFELWC